MGGSGRSGVGVPRASAVTGHFLVDHSTRWYYSPPAAKNPTRIPKGIDDARHIRGLTSLVISNHAKHPAAATEPDVEPATDA